MILVLNTIPVFLSTNLISEVREITILTALPSLSLPSTVLRSSISATPSKRAINLFSSEMFPAIPPTWKVRSVSCVPGSPID